MRKTGLLLAIAVAVISSAVVAAPAEYRPALSSYVSLGFGGPQHAADAVRYGFQLNYASLRGDIPSARLMEVSLNSQGFTTARLGGVDVLETLHILNQTDTTGASAPEAPPADKSVGEQMGSVFKGIGIGTGAVLLAGGVAAAVIIASAGGGDDEGIVRSGSSGSSQPDYCVGEIPPVIGNGCILSGSTFAFTGRDAVEVDRTALIERLSWLDSGTGQMGDLLTLSGR